MSKAKTQTLLDRPRPIYGFSFHQDFALELCIAQYPTCPFGCAKDGAPNCYANVAGLELPDGTRRQCEPGRMTQARANEYEAQLRGLRAGG